MFRVGIIGTENSHAMAFTRFFNLPQADTGEVPFPDIRIVGVYGKDPATAQQIIDEVDNTLFLAEKESDFIGKVDAMMITNRKGSEHAAAARPFIELGMPVFIDKPFTSDYAEAVELAEMAKRTGSKILAGSSVKLAPDVVIMQRIVTNLRVSGEFLSASFNYPADFESIYDGFFFYSPHLVEMALAVLGEGIESVQAFKARTMSSLLQNIPMPIPAGTSPRVPSSIRWWFTEPSAITCARSTSPLSMSWSVPNSPICSSTAPCRRPTSRLLCRFESSSASSSPWIRASR